MALFTIEMWARVADARAYLVDYRICVGGRVSSWLMIYVCINTYNMEIQQALASSLQGDPSLAKARSTRLGMVSNTATDTKHASALFLCLFFSQSNRSILTCTHTQHITAGAGRADAAALSRADGKPPGPGAAAGGGRRGPLCSRFAGIHVDGWMGGW